MLVGYAVVSERRTAAAVDLTTQVLYTLFFVCRPHYFGDDAERGAAELFIIMLVELSVGSSGVAWARSSCSPAAASLATQERIPGLSPGCGLILGLPQHNTWRTSQRKAVIEDRSSQVVDRRPGLGLGPTRSGDSRQDDAGILLHMEWRRTRVLRRPW